MKAFKNLLFLLPFLLIWLAPAGYYGYKATGWTVLLYSVPLFIFGLIPIVDFLIGKDPINPRESDVPRLEKVLYYRLLTMAYVPFQIALIAWGVYVIITDNALTGSIVALIGHVLSVGIMTGTLGITIGHELGHKQERIEQWLSQILLSTVSYTHFFIEHNLGHHQNVSTPHDPASSRFNESFYSFYPRTVAGSWLSAWHIETSRLQRKGKGAWSVSNRMIWYAILPVVWAALAGSAGFILGNGFSWLAAGFFIAQSVVGFTLLEIVNYLEHYGLARKETAPGKFETVTPLHSWNSNELLTNAFLFQLQRHSDHHANALRRYQSLRHFDESPQLPTGYAGMVLLALVPPLWFRVMNPRVMAFYNGKPPYFDNKVKIRTTETAA